MMPVSDFDTCAIRYDELINIIKKDIGSSFPDPETVNFYRYAAERKLWVEGEVDESVQEFAKMIVLWNMEDKNIPKEDRKPIWLYIHNYGGDVSVMWMLLDVIAASTTPVYTVNMGVAASAAALIFISGHKRFMMPTATVTLHEGSAEFSGDAIKVMDATDSYKKTIKKMKQFILEHTDIPQSMLNKKRANDWEIDSKYCIENNVCDVIVNNLDDIM